MGMDLIGVKPSNPTEEYFHNTIWALIPLWVHVASEGSDIFTERDIPLEGSNSRYY